MGTVLIVENTLSLLGHMGAFSEMLQSNIGQFIHILLHKYVPFFCSTLSNMLVIEG